MASIDKIYINEKEKLALVVGTDIPTQVIQNFEYENWDTIKDFNDKPIFDMNSWKDPMPKTCPTDSEEWHIGVQYCGLIELDKPIITKLPEIGKTHIQTHEMDDIYQNPDEVIVTEQPITMLIGELVANQKKV